MTCADICGMDPENPDRDANCRCTYAFYTCPCCCGGLPILSLIKFVIALPFCIVINFIGHILLTLWYYPVNIYYSGRTICQTPYWGLKLKILLLLLLPAASLAPLPLVILGSAPFSIALPLIVSFGTSFGFSFLFVDTESDGTGVKKEQLRSQVSNYCDMTLLPVVLSLDLCQDYHKFLSDGCYQFLEDLRSPTEEKR